LNPEYVFDPSTDEDREVVQRCKDGDADAFNCLFEKYYVPIRMTVYQHCNVMSDAEDLTQDVFCTIYQTIGTFQGRSKFRSWLYQITHNKIKNFLKYRRLRRHTSLTTLNDSEPFENEITDSIDPEIICSQKQLQKIMQEAIEALEPAHKQAIVLRDVEGFSYTEVSGILNVPQGTAKSRLHRGRVALRDHLNKILN
jgi:RNA polymerase sigma-70 factor, ECF subfamily